MAELSVRAHYINNPRQATLTLLKATFPLWGVVAPIAALTFTMATYFGFIHEGHLETSTIALAASVAGLLLIFLVGLATINWLSHDAVVIDKVGVKLPHSLLRFSRVLPWTAINR